MTSAYETNYAGIEWGTHTVAPRHYSAPSPNRADFPAPRVVGDFAAYECPVTGKMIEGRSAHAENLKATDCRILEPGEKEDNTRNGRLAAEAEDKKRDAAIDGIVDAVASEIL